MPEEWENLEGPIADWDVQSRLAKKFRQMDSGRRLGLGVAGALVAGGVLTIVVSIWTYFGLDALIDEIPGLFVGAILIMAGLAVGAVLLARILR